MTENKPMTMGDLKQSMKDFPDDYEIHIVTPVRVNGLNDSVCLVSSAIRIFKEPTKPYVFIACDNMGYAEVEIGGKNEL